MSATITSPCDPNIDFAPNERHIQTRPRDHFEPSSHAESDVVQENDPTFDGSHVAPDLIEDALPPEYAISEHDPRLRWTGGDRDSRADRKRRVIFIAAAAVYVGVNATFLISGLEQPITVNDDITTKQPNSNASTPSESLHKQYVLVALWCWTLSLILAIGATAWSVLASQDDSDTQIWMVYGSVWPCIDTQLFDRLVTRSIPATLCLSVLLFLLGLSTFLLTRSKALAVVCFTIVGLAILVTLARNIASALERRRGQPGPNGRPEGDIELGRSPWLRAGPPPIIRRPTHDDEPATDPTHGPDTDGAGGRICSQSSCVMHVASAALPDDLQGDHSTRLEPNEFIFILAAVMSLSSAAFVIVGIRTLRALYSGPMREKLVSQSEGYLSMPAIWVGSIWLLSLAASLTAVLLTIGLHHTALNTIAHNSTRGRRGWLLHPYRLIDSAQCFTLAEAALRVSAHLFYAGCSVHLFLQASIGATLLGCICALPLMLAIASACTKSCSSSKRRAFENRGTLEKPSDPNYGDKGNRRNQDIRMDDVPSKSTVSLPLVWHTRSRYQHHSSSTAGTIKSFARPISQEISRPPDTYSLFSASSEYLALMPCPPHGPAPLQIRQELNFGYNCGSETQRHDARLDLIPSELTNSSPEGSSAPDASTDGRMIHLSVNSVGGRRSGATATYPSTIAKNRQYLLVSPLDDWKLERLGRTSLFDFTGSLPKYVQDGVPSLSPPVQPLSSPISMREAPRANRRRTEHVGRSCPSCHDMRQKSHQDLSKYCHACSQCLNSAKPNLCRRSAASKLVEAQQRVTSSEAIVQRLSRYQNELQRECHHQAQVLRLHGFEEPPLLGHALHSPRSRPAMNSLSITNSTDLGPNRTPSGVPFSGATKASPICQGGHDMDYDVFSNLSHGHAYNEPRYASSVRPCAVSRLEAPLSDVILQGTSDVPEFISPLKGNLGPYAQDARMIINGATGMREAACTIFTYNHFKNDLDPTRVAARCTELLHLVDCSTHQLSRGLLLSRDLTNDGALLEKRRKGVAAHVFAEPLGPGSDLLLSAVHGKAIPRKPWSASQLTCLLDSKSTTDARTGFYKWKGHIVGRGVEDIAKLEAMITGWDCRAAQPILLYTRLGELSSYPLEERSTYGSRWTQADDHVRPESVPEPKSSTSSSISIILAIRSLSEDSSRPAQLLTIFKSSNDQTEKQQAGLDPDSHAPIFVEGCWSCVDR